jgi:flagellar basal-body rod protein FlgB
MADLFGDLTTVVLTKSLDATGMRHRVIADNIANVETPGFTRSDVNFEAQLQEALASSDPESAMRRVEDMAPEAEQDTLSPAGPNGNNVNIDKEMAGLTKNGLQYDAMVELLNLKGSMVRLAINEGKR